MRQGWIIVSSVLSFLMHASPAPATTLAQRCAETVAKDLGGRGTHTQWKLAYSDDPLIDTHAPRLFQALRDSTAQRNPSMRINVSTMVSAMAATSKNPLMQPYRDALEARRTLTPAEYDEVIEAILTWRKSESPSQPLELEHPLRTSIRSNLRYRYPFLQKPEHTHHLERWVERGLNEQLHRLSVYLGITPIAATPR